MWFYHKRIDGSRTMNKTLEKNSFIGILCSLAAFVIWGFAPVYWKQISHVSSMELLGHRILWGCLCLLLLMFFKRGKKLFNEIIEKGDYMLFVSSLLIFANWFLFIWSVNNGHILDASLGYYLTPLLNVVTGYFFFGEKMRPVKIQALLLASIGVGLLFISNSGSPWISLLLTGTFSFYGYLKKKSSLSAQSALLFEMSIWVIPVLFYFLYLNNLGTLEVIQAGGRDLLFLFFAGAITIAPLWFYNTAIKHLDLGTVGFLQYLAPSLQLVVGILIYKEDFSNERFISFGLIWLGIFLFTIDGLFNKRKNAK